MKNFNSWWSKAFPYVMGTIFGLSVALLVISIVMFQRVSSSRPFLPAPLEELDTEDIPDVSGSAMVSARKLVAPAVVTITAYKTKMVYDRPRSSYEWFMQFSGRMPRRRKEKYPNFGSGIIVNPDGYILTNEHVIRNADEIYITLPDSAEKKAVVAGKTVSFDLALLKIDGEGYYYAPLGNSDDLEIGETVIAIGSPFTYLFNDTQPTVTSGVISALRRDVRQGEGADHIFNNMIQTDAAINPGNSGGPLVSRGGKVIGINTFILSGNNKNNSIGMGFAIPVNTARMVMEEIINYGRFRQVWTGLGVVELDEEMVERFSLPFDNGLFIQQIEKGGPAEAADLKVGDVIIKINGKEVDSFIQANRLIFGKRVGDILRITVWRDGELLKVELKLAESLDRA
ncbi:MAG: trypsin-like peptidase domain-containing protein [Candidatus Krumholzibacteriota bacterium]|nr:trypsin-like peptidase domain-containing protein [Candidatus Krumholzibacteriota bacterium]